MPEIFSTPRTARYVRDHVDVLPSCKLVLLMLVVCAQSDGWVRRIKTERLADWTGLGDKTVRRAIHALERDGWIICERRRKTTDYNLSPVMVTANTGHGDRWIMSSTSRGGPVWNDEQHTNPGYCRDCGPGIWHASRPQDDLCAKCAGKRIEAEYQQQVVSCGLCSPVDGHHNAGCPMA